MRTLGVILVLVGLALAAGASFVVQAPGGGETVAVEGGWQPPDGPR